MADEITITDANKNELLAETERLNKLVTASTLDYGNAAQKANGFLSNFTSGLRGAHGALSNLGRLASDHTTIFTALGNSLLNVSGSFKQLSLIDGGSINTFSAPLKDLSAILGEGGKASDDARKRLGQLQGAFNKAGMGEEFAKSMAAGGNAIINLLSRVTESADRFAVLQGDMIQTAAATGELGTLFSKAGDSLQGMNDMLAMQQDAMNKSQAATHSSDEQMQNYFNLMKQIPGAMKEVVNLNAEGTKTTSMLTAAIKLAHGTGMNYKEIIDDLHTSFTEYGVTGEKALKFTASFSEISQRYGLELKDVRSGLLGAADAFKNITNAGEDASKMQANIAKTMNDYIQRLKDTGMSGKHAIETVKDMTGAVSQLSTAQKAFLSAQSGGPGGLMGAARITGMLRRGDIEGVMDMMQKVMQKPEFGGGKIVTQEEAERSQSAAALQQKQIMMLRQGPLGLKLKSDDDAIRFLEAMKARQEGRPTSAGAIEDLNKDNLQNAMERGSKAEERTQTIFSGIAEDVSAIARTLTVTSGETFQKYFTGTPTSEGVSVEQATRRDILNKRNERSQLEESEATEYRRQEMDNKKHPIGGMVKKMVEGSVGKINSTNLSDTVNLAKTTADAFEEDTGKLMKRDDSQQQRANIRAEADRRKQAANAATRQTRTTTAGQQVQQAAVQQATAPASPGNFKFMGINSETGDMEEIAAGSKVRGATRAPVPVKGATGGSTAPESPMPTTVVQEAPEGLKVTVKVEQVGSQARAAAPALGLR